MMKVRVIGDSNPPREFQFRGRTLNIHAAMRSLHEGLRAALAESGSYEKALRGAGWAEGPVAIVGKGASASAALAGAQALEWLLGWPARALEAEDFLSYSLTALRPRSIVIAVFPAGEDETLSEITARATRQGAHVIALTANPESPAVKPARAVLRLPSAALEHAHVARPLIEHTALFLVATLAAKIFNPRNPQLEHLQLENLPDCAARVEIHLSDPVRSLALELRDCRVRVAGGRFYYPAALRVAALARQTAAPAFEALTIADAEEFAPGALNRGDAFLLLSGASSKAKKRLLSLAGRLKETPARLFALTSSMDQDLPKLCQLSLLAPDLPEIAASLMSMIVLERLMLERASRSNERSH